MNYKKLKQKIKREIAVTSSLSSLPASVTVDQLAKSTAEVEFFRVLREELQVPVWARIETHVSHVTQPLNPILVQKTSNFFASTEGLFRTRHHRVEFAFMTLKVRAWPASL